MRRPPSSRGMTAVLRQQADLLNLVQDAILVTDFTENRISFWNRAARDLYGWSQEEALGQVAADLLRTGFPDSFAAVQDALAREGHWEGELIHVTRSGQRVVVSSRWALRRGGAAGEAGAAGEPSAVLEANRDITERVRAEQVVAENETRQRAFFRDVLWSVTEGKLRLCDTADELPIPLPPSGAAIDLAAESLSQLRVRVRQEVAHQSLPLERGHDLLTAAGEVALNAIVHAGGGRARIHSAGGRIQVWVEDQGRGIDVGRLPRATLERGFSTRGTLGHGFFLVLATVDRAWLLTGPTGTTVVLEQHQQAAEPAWLRGMGMSRAA